MSNRFPSYYLLIIAVVALLLGRGLQGVIWDYPLRSLLWDEGIMAPVVQFFGGNWGDWVSSEAVDRGIQTGIRSMGWILVLSAILLCFPAVRRSSGGRWLIIASGGILLLVILLGYKANFWRIGYLIEHALQLGAPFLLLAYLRGRPLHDLAWPLRILTALTFVGHGMFAVGYYPIPAHFVLMTTEGLGAFWRVFAGAEVDASTANWFLRTVGILDFIAAALILLPGRKLLRWGLYWIIPWAVLTTLARVWSNGQFSTGSNLLWLWTPAFLFRLPHVLLPLLLWKVKVTANAS